MEVLKCQKQREKLEGVWANENGDLEINMLLCAAGFGAERHPQGNHCNNPELSNQALQLE